MPRPSPSYFSVQKSRLKAAWYAERDAVAMADRYFSAIKPQKVIDKNVYMCIIIHIQHETHRESRRRETLVPAGGGATVAPSFGISVLTSRALHSRELFGVCLWGGACQLRSVRAGRKTADLVVCS